jgi:hypothetical protein
MYEKIAYEMFLEGFVCVDADDVEDYLRKGKTTHLTKDEIDAIEDYLEVFNV